MPEKLPTRLFLYVHYGVQFVRRTDSFDLMFFKKGLLQQTIDRRHVSFFDRHYIELFSGYVWSAMVFPDKKCFFEFSKPDEPQYPAVVIRENLLERVYDMANRQYLYQQI